MWHATNVAPSASPDRSIESSEFRPNMESPHNHFMHRTVCDRMKKNLILIELIWNELICFELILNERIWSELIWTD
jgi:hypothetical protein